MMQTPPLPKFTLHRRCRGIVTQVLYRNGMPFRPQDWSQLKKIAEGNNQTQ
jgi:hypothetical protein